ncbi:MAG TPA: hypothetical protein VFC21_10265 [Bryobacteraceae bacterium]|nr:hypothetical protein [Bryobacteraceae bacterium]
MKRTAFLLCFAGLIPLYAQESQLGADFRGEGTRFEADCTKFSFGSIGSCAELLFTDHPLHLAVGSIAPQNGFGVGPAFVAHWTPNETWRLSWDTDAVASVNGSWRAGAYMTAVLTRHGRIGVSTGGNSVSVGKSNLAVQDFPVIHGYAQAISLNKIAYFGEGPASSAAARSYFGMRETIVGTNVIWPVAGALRLALFGEANGRFVNIRASNGEPSPSIGQLYSDATAPGLSNQPAFAQFGEGVRLTPQLAGGHVRLNYSFTFQQYAAASSSSSFRRFTADLVHEFPLYSKTREVEAREFNGPDDCRADPLVANCPKVVQKTRNRDGSFGVRFLYTDSFVSAGHQVPFYFQPTLGGSDINGNPLLSSYQDYRFRAPNLMVLRGSFEHSLYGPFGVAFLVDEGKTALKPGDLDFSHLAHSYSAGLTLRAGGFPAVSLMFAWGGHEGTHTIAALNTSLLGGSARPSLF